MAFFVSRLVDVINSNHSSPTFEIKGRFATGRKFFKTFGSRDVFIKIGVMTALLKWLGTVDVEKESFKILVINGNSTGRHCFTIQVGNGSDAQDFDDDNLINFSTSCSGTESELNQIRLQEGRNH